MMSTAQSLVAATVLAVVMTQPAPVQAPPGLGEGWLGEFDHSSRQLLQLAEATPAETFSWRPAPGVRSVAEVYMHIALGNQVLLGRAGAKPSVDLSKLAQPVEKSIADKAGVIKFLRESQEAVRSQYPKADRSKKVQFFQKAVTADDLFLRILVHNHEHMGQAIAYARMNGVTPPWSAGGSQ